VSLVSADIDASTRAARVRIIVDNTLANLKPGQFARVTLSPLAKGEAELSVPEEAVQFVEGQSSVFVAVAGEANTFARKPVIVGRTVNGFVPIIDGIGEHDSVVIAGSFTLKAELGKGAAEHTH
jgi:membrane fusion protein, heavy metal efflux system